MSTDPSNKPKPFFFLPDPPGTVSFHQILFYLYPLQHPSLALAVGFAFVWDPDRSDYSPSQGEIHTSQVRKKHYFQSGSFPVHQHKPNSNKLSLLLPCNIYWKSEHKNSSRTRELHRKLFTHRLWAVLPSRCGPLDQQVLQTLLICNSVTIQLSPLDQIGTPTRQSRLECPAGKCSSMGGCKKCVSAAHHQDTHSLKSQRKEREVLLTGTATFSCVPGLHCQSSPLKTCRKSVCRYYRCSKARDPPAQKSLLHHQSEKQFKTAQVC